MSAQITAEFAREYQKKIPFVSHLRILTETLGSGTATLSLPVEPHLTNSLGSVHGGAYAAPGIDRRDHHQPFHVVHRRGQR